MELSDRQLSNMIDEMQTLGSRLRNNTDALEMKASQDRGLKEGLEEFNFHIRNQNQEISKLTEEIQNYKKTIIKNEINSSYQDFINSLIQLSIAQKSGSISPNLCADLITICVNRNKKYIQYWPEDEYNAASDLLNEITALNKKLSSKETSTQGENARQ